MEAEDGRRAEVHDRPLISFCLFTYNQERFIREAVEGAFSQTYSPLEIILSDDCSTDRTFEIIKEMSAIYHGPHRIVLNRNPKNLGNGSHVNRVMEIAQGVLVVAAAGDDISCPQRTQALYDEWLKQNKRPTLIHSDYKVINEKGLLIEESTPRCSFAGCRSAGIQDIKEFVQGKHPASGIIGATQAWSCKILRKMGPLRRDVFFEDKIFCFRSLITGEFAYVPQKLVCYRMHSNNLIARLNNDSSRIVRIRKYLLQELINNFRWLAVISNLKDDAIGFTNQGILSKREGHATLREIDHCMVVKKCEWKVCSTSPFIGLAWLLCRLVLRPEPAYAWCALRHWSFRSADYMRLLPKQ